jgi:O-antigen/teichoic acid export membrane protein
MALVLLALSGAMAAGVLRAPQLTAELRIATGLVLFGTVNGVQTGALVGFGDFRTLAVLNAIRGICLCGFLIAGVALDGVRGGVIGLVLTEVVAVVANHLALRRLRPAPAAWPDRGAAWAEARLMCRFSGWSLLGSVCTMSAMWFANLVLVAQPQGYAALGVFNAAERWRQLLLFLPASFSPVILTMLSNLHGRSEPDAYRRLFGLNLAVSVGVVVVPSIAVMWWATPAMGLFGDEYAGGRATLVVLAASSVAVVLNNLFGQVLVSRGAVVGRFLLDALLAALLVLASWQLIPAHREQGMALASALAFAVTAVAVVATTIRLTGAGEARR